MSITITMIDTVVLSIPNAKYKILDPKRFKPYFYPFDPYNADERIRFLQENKGLKKYIQNPKASLRDEGIVYPNLRIDERMREGVYACDLKTSFSCPKILWSHSFEEISDIYFKQIVEILQTRLREMEVEVRNETLKNSIVHTLHYCANIMFPSEEEARMFLNRIGKTSLGAWFENNSKTFSNDGRAVRFHTDIFEIVFYLKYYDVLEKNNRAVGRKTTLQEKEIANRLLKEGKIPPVVRLEIRFNGLRSIRTHLKAALGLDKQYWTFQEVFDSQNSRKTQKYYWNKIIGDQINYACLSTVSDEDICEKVINKYTDEKIRNIAEPLGLFYLTKNLGVKRIKALITLRQNRKAWYDKRKKIIFFARKFSNSNDNLIKIVTSVLENKPVQLGLPL